MPTVFERLSGSVQSDQLHANLGVQITKIGDAGNLLSGFISNPPSSIGDFLSGIADVALPNVNVTGALSGNFTSLGDAIPSDTSSITGGLTSALGGLKGSVTSNLIPQITQFIEGVQALYKLSQTNFTDIVISAQGGATSTSGGGAAASGGTGTGTPSTGSGAPPSGAPPATTGGSAPGASAAAEARVKRLEEVNNINATLSIIPAPLNAPAVVLLLQSQLQRLPRDIVDVRHLPVIDELIEMLSTVVALRETNPAGLKTYIEDTVEQLAAYLDNIGQAPLEEFTNELSDLAANLDDEALKEEAQTLTAKLRSIGTALASSNLSGVGADITQAGATLDTLLTRLSALNTNLFDGQVDESLRKFQRLPNDMDWQMRQIVRAVRPPNNLKLIEGIGDQLHKAADAAEPEALSRDVEELLAGVTKSLQMLDVSIISGPLGTLAEGARQAADGLDNLLSQAASQTALLFDEVDKVLAEIDVSAITDAVKKAFDDFSRALQQKVNELFAPIQQAISQGVTLIVDAVKDFDLEDIVNVLREVVTSLTSVLKSPEVVNAVNAVKQTIQTVADQLKKLSFAPVTDQVIAAIKEITTALQAINPDELSFAVKGALTAAVAILPPDLKPLTDPLIEELQKLINDGPRPLLQSVLDQPAKLLDQVKQYSPDKLIGDQLSKPFNDLIAELEKFKPSALLKPVQDALDQLKAQLRERANPGQLLAPLEGLYNQLLAQFDKLKPEEIVKPLEDVIKEVIDSLLDALPADEFLSVFDEILAKIKGVVDLANGVKSLLTKMVELLDGLKDAETQLREWVNPTIERIDQISDIASLQPSFDNLTQAVNNLRAADLKGALNEPLAPLKTALTALDARTLLGDISTAYRGIRRDAVTALPASAQKTQLLALLDRFDPLDAAFSRPFEELSRWLEEIPRHEAALDALLAHWDVRFHGPRAPLSESVVATVSAADLKLILRAALEEEFVKPFGNLLAVFFETAKTASAPLQKVTEFIDAFQQKVDDLLLGQDSFGGINEALHQLVDRLRSIDLQFLVRELKETFDAVKSKLEAVSPTALRVEVEKVFDDALKLLDVSKLLPKSELDKIDAAYQKLVDDLKKLDPKKLVVDIIQPEFDNTVMPLLKAFDITAVIQAALDRMDGLEGELKSEFERVNKAYKEMLDAVPTISLMDISLDIDVDIDIGF
jgi:hypothetical protein